MLRSWNSDWKAEAEFMFRLSDSNPRISVVGFSWGAGWGVMQLAKQLERRGLSIHHACLIDPVYRHPYLLGQWRAFVPWIPIMVPRNVKRVTWWRQVMNWPRGHELVGLNEKTRIEQPFYVPATHSNMDDQPRILDECYHICQTELTT
jgi:pimeloyl-ACP methyl ester carboxylesterase